MKFKITKNNNSVIKMKLIYNKEFPIILIMIHNNIKIKSYYYKMKFNNYKNK